MEQQEKHDKLKELDTTRVLLLGLALVLAVLVWIYWSQSGEVQEIVYVQSDNTSVTATTDDQTDADNSSSGSSGSSSSGSSSSSGTSSSSSSKTTTTTTTKEDETEQEALEEEPAEEVTEDKIYTEIEPEDLTVSSSTDTIYPSDDTTTSNSSSNTNDSSSSSSLSSSNSSSSSSSSNSSSADDTTSNSSGNSSEDSTTEDSTTDDSTTDVPVADFSNAIALAQSLETSYHISITMATSETPVTGYTVFTDDASLYSLVQSLQTALQAMPSDIWTGIVNRTDIQLILQDGSNSMTLQTGDDQMLLTMTPTTMDLTYELGTQVLLICDALLAEQGDLDASYTAFSAFNPTGFSYGSPSTSYYNTTATNTYFLTLVAQSSIEADRMNLFASYYAGAISSSYMTQTCPVYQKLETLIDSLTTSLA